MASMAAVSSRDLWDALNENLVSNAIGALIFGLIAAWLFHRYSAQQERTELAERARTLLRDIVKDNLQEVAAIREAVAKRTCRMTPQPLNAVSLELLLRSKAADALEPDLALALGELLHSLNIANALHRDLRERLFGLAAAIGGGEAFRDQLFERLPRALTRVETFAEQVMDAIPAT